MQREPFEYLWQFALAAGGVLLGWLHVGRNKELDEMRVQIEGANKQAAEAKAELAAHKLYAAENFAKKSDVERIVDKAEQRLTEKLTQQHEAWLERLDDIRDRLPSKN